MTLSHRIAAACAAVGLDLAAATTAGAYNREVDPPWRLPSFDRPDALVVVVGNTRALWPRFLAVLAREPERLETAHPLDQYVAELVEAALAGLELAFTVRHAAAMPPDGVAIQRLAHVAGLASIGPGRLCVHPVFGPWIALRAAVIVDAAGPRPSPPRDSPCAACGAGCARAFEAARGAGDWRRWLAARDACPVGRAHRYSDGQIRYHYTKDRRALRAAISASPPGPPSSS